MRRLFSPALVAGLVLSLAARTGTASISPIFEGDPVDPATGRAYAILPGVPLVMPQGHGDPPLVDPSVVGDVDVVVRAAHLGVGPMMPQPVATLPVAVAGGIHVVGGSEIPFTVFAADASGSPLGGPGLDGIPVVVVAYADLDRDGIVGPTDDDVDGSADNGREREESGFLVGRQVAVFANGAATGTLAVHKGAPASAGGLTVVLTAVAYVGDFSPNFFMGELPDGPGVATLLPFFPRIDPDRVFGGNGGGGPANPDGRLNEIELAPAFMVPVRDPVLGTPFALPTDGTSATIDRARVDSGSLSRLRFVRPSVAADFPDVDPEIQTPLFPGAGGALLEALASAAVVDDGPGDPTRLRLVPVDVLDNVTDPPATAVATLVAGAGLAITAPDADGNPGTETIANLSAAGIEIALDDQGGAGDGPATATLAILTDGFPTEVLAVTFTPGGGGTTTTTTSTATTTSTTTSTVVTTTTTTSTDASTTTEATASTTTTTATDSTTTTTCCAGSPPVIAAAVVTGAPWFVAGCPADRTLVAVVDDPDGDPVRVHATLELNGTLLPPLELLPGTAPPDTALPPGTIYTARLTLDAAAPGTLAVTVTAEDARGAAAAPAPAEGSPFRVLSATDPGVVPFLGAVTLTPDTIPVRDRSGVFVAVRVSDDCGISQVTAESDNDGDGIFDASTPLVDNGRRGDTDAADGLFSRQIRFRERTPGTVLVRVRAVNQRMGTAVSDPPAVLQVVAP